MVDSEPWTSPHYFVGQFWPFWNPTWFLETIATTRFQGLRNFLSCTCAIRRALPGVMDKATAALDPEPILDCWLVVYLPLWKIWVRQLGWWHSQYIRTNKKCSKIPNHQPDCFYWWAKKEIPQNGQHWSRRANWAMLSSWCLAWSIYLAELHVASHPEMNQCWAFTFTALTEVDWKPLGNKNTDQKHPQTQKCASLLGSNDLILSPQFSTLTIHLIDIWNNHQFVDRFPWETMAFWVKNLPSLGEKSSFTWLSNVATEPYIDGLGAEKFLCKR